MFLNLFKTNDLFVFLDQNIYANKFERSEKIEWKWKMQKMTKKKIWKLFKKLSKNEEIRYLRKMKNKYRKKKNEE